MPVGDIDFSWESFVNTTPPYMVFEYTAVGMFTGWDYNTGLEPYDPSATWLIASTSVPEPASLYLLGLVRMRQRLRHGTQTQGTTDRNDRCIATNRQGQVGGATDQAKPVVLGVPRVRSLSTEASTDVSPDVEQVHILLIKPGHPFDAPFHRLRGDIQPRRGKRIAQEVKAPADPVR